MGFLITLRFRTHSCSCSCTRRKRCVNDEDDDGRRWRRDMVPRYLNKKKNTLSSVVVIAIVANTVKPGFGAPACDKILPLEYKIFKKKRKHSYLYLGYKKTLITLIRHIIFTSPLKCARAKFNCSITFSSALHFRTVAFLSFHASSLLLLAFKSKYHHFHCCPVQR